MGIDEARAKLTKLGLTEDDFKALVRGSEKSDDADPS